MKMNNQNENIVTHFFAWLAAVASMLGITTQDMVYILFGFIGVVISLASCWGEWMHGKSVTKTVSERSCWLIISMACSRNRFVNAHRLLK